MILAKDANLASFALPKRHIGVFCSEGGVNCLEGEVICSVVEAFSLQIGVKNWVRVDFCSMVGVNCSDSEVDCSDDGVNY